MSGPDLSGRPPTPPVPQVPVDDMALDAIEHALGGAYRVDEDGTRHLVGAEYTLTSLLDLWAGIDPKEQGTLVDPGDPGGLGITAAAVYEMPGTYLTERDVIRALIAEVRRLRAATGTEGHP